MLLEGVGGRSVRGRVGGRVLKAIAVYGFFRGIAWSGFMYLYPLYVLSIGYHTADLGPIATYASLASALVLPVAGYFIDVGYAPHVAVVSGVCVAGSLILPVISPTYLGLVAGYALSYVAFMLWSPSRASMVALLARPEVLGRIFGIYTLLYNIARVVTPYMLGHALAHATYGQLMSYVGVMILLATAGFAVAVTPFVKAVKGGVEGAADSAWSTCINLRGVGKVKCMYLRTFVLDRRLVPVAIFGVLDRFGWSLWMPLLNAYLKEFAGFTDEVVGLYNTLMGAGMLASSLPAGYLTDKVGALEVLVANEFLGAAGTLMLALGTGPVILASAIPLGISISLWITSYNTVTSVILGAGSVGRARAGVDATRILAAIPAPLVGSALFSGVSTLAPFTVGAALMLLATAPLIASKKK